jgi:hypothetical protein
VTQLVDSLQRDILDGRRTAVAALQALGARYVLLRRDLDPTFPGRSFIPAQRLAHALPRVHGLRHVRSFGIADLYETAHVPAAEVYPAVPVLDQGANDASLYRGLDLGPKTALVSPAGRRLLGNVKTGEVRLVPAPPGRVSAMVVRGKNGITIRLKKTGVHNRLEAHLGKLAPPLSVLVGEERFALSTTRDVVSLDATRAAPLLYRFRPPLRSTRVAIDRSLARGLGDCNRFDNRTPREVGLFARVVERDGIPTLRLGAREHSACVAKPITFRPEVPLMVRLEYRGVSGNAPRVCVWEEGPRRCAETPSLAVLPGWHRLEAAVTPQTGTQSLRLFLYADGGGGARTVTEYRDIAIRRPQPVLPVGAVPLDRLPNVSSRQLTPSEFRVHVKDAHGPFVLVLTETYAPGWHIEIDGHDSNGLAHLRVNGYANGWRVPWRGTYDFTITYAPERLARLAGLADLVLVPLSLMLFLGWRVWTRRRAGARYLEDRRPPEPVSPELVLVDPELSKRARRGESASPDEE